MSEGRVSVDGQLVTQMGARVDPATARISVDGRRVPIGNEWVYLALNKPRGVVSTMHDPAGRACVGDLLSGWPAGVFHVGRLDADTEGLLLVTNHGELGHRLAHPSFRVQKTYAAEVEGPLATGLGRILTKGVVLDDGPVAVDSFRVLSTSNSRVMVEVVLHEGRNHVVRRLLASVGHPVSRLVRVAVGGVTLGDLRPGDVRELPASAVGDLLELVDL
jgi:23S rRNA pseudouridine2605 synthase